MTSHIRGPAKLPWRASERTVVVEALSLPKNFCLRFTETEEDKTVAFSTDDPEVIEKIYDAARLARLRVRRRTKG